MSICGQSFRIGAGTHEVVVAEVGAGLREYRAAGVEVTYGYGEDTLPPRACGVTLVPWPNRVRDGRYTFDGVEQQLALTEPKAGNAIHGLGRWERWAVVEHDASRVTLALDVVPQNGYPHELQVEVTYALDAVDGLTVSTTARNTGTDRAPFGAGAHPYLSTRGHLLDEVTVRLPASTVLLADDRGIPTGTRPVSGADDLRAGRALGTDRFDTGFTDVAHPGGRGVAEVHTPSGGARLWFDEAYGFLQLYTPDAMTPSTAGVQPVPAVAVEPMSCAADAFNSGHGLVVLEPGDTWAGSWGITPL